MRCFRSHSIPNINCLLKVIVFDNLRKDWRKEIYPKDVTRKNIRHKIAGSSGISRSKIPRSSLVSAPPINNGTWDLTKLPIQLSFLHDPSINTYKFYHKQVNLLVDFYFKWVEVKIVASVAYYINALSGTQLNANTKQANWENNN